MNAITRPTSFGALSDLVFLSKRLVFGAHRVRRARIYGVGIGKSGTHSLARMFAGTVKSRHEPGAMQLIDRIFERFEGRISESEMVDWLHRRDRAMGLEVDSAGLNYLILDLLLREFPDARFVLTIRDCYSWADSLMNQQLRLAEADPRWSKLDRYYHGRQPVVYGPEEHLLSANQLYPLERYFVHWTMRNQHVLQAIPTERLFVVRTDQLKQRAFELADFAGLPRRAIRLHRTHEFRNSAKRSFLRKMDKAFIEQCADKHCRLLMSRFFPEIKSIEDAFRVNCD